MTTDKLPETKNDGPEVTLAPHSSAEEAIKEASIESESKDGRKIKFVPESRSARVSFAAAGLLGGVVVLLLIVMLTSGGTKVKKQTTQGASSVEIKDLDPDNNSEGYTQSAPGDFSGYSLNLDFSQPSLIKSTSVEVSRGQQASWDDGFAILATSVDRDYRPASEFDYKKATEAGDELVRVNLLVGNASALNMPIGYSDLSLYAEGSGMERAESERVSEDIYSPKEGQVLGAKQTQKISLHYRVKRGQQFYITRSKTFDQRRAKVKSGEEKNPTLTLKINL